jgi:sugar lactone lactonase YvrE
MALLAAVAFAWWPASATAQASFTTLITTPLPIEGLTGDGTSLFTVGRGTDFCPLWRINLARPGLELVGSIPAPCSPSGVALRGGEAFAADGDRVWALTPSASSPPTARVFASGVPGTNGIAFDRDGNLWTGDGTTGQGRVWMATRGGQVSEVFRVPPIASDAGAAGGVGRDVRTLPPGTVTVTASSRNAADSAGSQPLVANGLAFDRDGDLYVADTARGALWRVEFDGSGRLESRTGCDGAYAANTLCLDNVFVAHPYLEGVDGIVIDAGGNIWCSVNERQAIVVVTPSGRVVEVFRNPLDPATRLRNAGPLEFPTSPYVDRSFVCTANSDGNRRDNSPNAAGQVTPAGPARGKISCLGR